MGHGKTTLLGSGVGDPRIMPMLFLDLEGGHDAILSKVRQITPADLGKVKPLDNKIDLIRIREWSDYILTYNWLEAHPTTYRTVAIDSLTEANYLVVQTIVEEATKRSSRHDPDIAEQMDYQRGAVWMRRLVRSYRDLPMNFLATALPIEGVDPVSRATCVQPSFVGKLAQEVPAQFGVVGYLGIVETPATATGKSEVHRILFVQPVGRFWAKDRSEGGRLGESVPDPTLPKILDLLEGV